MLGFGLHFAYLPMHIVMSIILLSLAWLVQMCVSHVYDGVHMPILFAIIFHYIK